MSRKNQIEQSEGKSRTMLMLDDDVHFAGILQDFLEENSYEVTQVADGAKGLRHALAAEFDVILCDMVMPDFPGDMFYRAVRELKPQMCQKIVFMTGHRRNPEIVKFFKDVRAEPLYKPFSLRDLLRISDRICERICVAKEPVRYLNN